MEYHGILWNAMEFHGVSMEFHEVTMEFHGMPCSSTEFHVMSWNSMDCSWSSGGVLRSSMEYR